MILSVAFSFCKNIFNKMGRTAKKLMVEIDKNSISRKINLTLPYVILIWGLIFLEVQLLSILTIKSLEQTQHFALDSSLERPQWQYLGLFKHLAGMYCTLHVTSFCWMSALQS